MIDHDRLFKELLTNFFFEFIELFCPRLSQEVELGRVEFLDKEMFTDILEGNQYEADIVARVRFRGQDAFFLIHVENQAYVQADFAHRMFRYYARLDEKYGLPVYPIAVISYEKPLRPEPDRYRVVFPDMTPIDFRFRVIQLNRLNWRDFLRHANPVASALMAKMRIAVKDRPQVKVECLRLLATLRLNPAKMKLISGFVDTYLRLSRQENQVFKRQIEDQSFAEKEEVMEIVTSWLEEGLQKGLQKGLQQGLEQGIQQGIQQGMQTGLEQGMNTGKKDEAERLVLRQLQRRVGGVTADQQARLKTMTTAQLEELAEALLDFTTVSDLEKWLAEALPA